MTSELTSFPHGSQVLEVREAIRRPRSLQATLAGTAGLAIRGQARFPLTYLRCRLLLQGVKVAESGDIGRNAPVVELAGRLVQFMVLWHWSDNALFEPGGEGFDRLASNGGLRINVEDMGGTPWTVAFSEPRDCAVVQELDPFDGSVDTIAVADGEPGEAFVLFVPQRYLLPSFFLESFESLMEVSNSFGVLFHVPVVDPVSLLDGLDKRCGELTESDWVTDVEALYEVSC